MIDTIRLSETTKRQLITLKRQTGMAQWNILCRWALCRSLSDPTPVTDTGPAKLSNVEMAWKVFCGRNEKLYFALLKSDYERTWSDQTEISITRHTQLHIERGVGAFASDRSADLYSWFQQILPLKGT